MQISVGPVRTTVERAAPEYRLYDFSIRIVSSESDLISLIDQGSLLPGYLGNLAALIADQTGLVDVPNDRRAQAARLLRQAAALLES